MKEQSMTKNDAIKAMNNGKKVSHIKFTPDEWMMTSDRGYEFEDGAKCTKEEFWRFRNEEAWLSGWRLYT